MQKFLLFNSFLLLFLAGTFTRLNDQNEVITALRTGNATELAKYIDDNVELAMPDKTDTYSKAQAVVILQDFFTNNGVKNFEVKHTGDKGGSLFYIGTLQTKAGNYRTTVFMKTLNSKQLIKGIQFQAE